MHLSDDNFACLNFLKTILQDAKNTGSHGSGRQLFLLKYQKTRNFYAFF